VSTPSHYAYLKISEGCDKRCSFCVIPSIRGRQASRPVEDLIQEARGLAENGARELILVAQDTGDYGTDLYGERALPRLLAGLEAIEDLRWIRLMYVYPESITDGLIDTIASSDKILRYLDIPFQHASDRVLATMRRASRRAEIDATLAALRERLPGVAIRSTFIVGFPGELDSDVLELAGFLREARLNRVGVFEFSREEGTDAYDMPGQVDAEDKRLRLGEVMELQEAISGEILASWVGSTLEVVVDEEDEGGEGVYIARSYMDAPEVDGVVYVYSNAPLEPGDFLEVLVTDSMEHDLIGRPVCEAGGV
jgi:ribosomal protein S12 methylthiotransferase